MAANWALTVASGIVFGLFPQIDLETAHLFGTTATGFVMRFVLNVGTYITGFAFYAVVYSFDVALIPAAQGIGQSAGPFLAGTLLDQHLGFARMLGVVALFAVGSLVSYSSVYIHLRRTRPLAARA